MSVTKNSFNSIKVRLKLNRIKLKGAIILFQFHKGTIKTQISQPTQFTETDVSIP